MNNTSVYDKMSSGENLVSDFLSSLGIYWIFESPVFVTDDKGRPRVWTPDFYLPEFGIYIEVMGPYGNYEYRALVYEKNRVPVVFIDPYNDQYWEHKIKDAIWEIHNLRYDMVKDITNKFKDIIR